MASRFPGVASLVFLAAAVAIGFISMISESMTLGGVYLAASVVAGLSIVYLFCTKCSEKMKCGHILPGIIAGKMPQRGGKYTTADLLGVVLAMAVVVLMPQTWLLKDLLLFAVFWVLVAAAGAQVSLFMCRSCGNAACPLKKG